MKITQLHVYPIKSLRSISVPTAELCSQGLAYDRRYILLSARDDGTYHNMFVGDLPEMALFHCDLCTTFSAAANFKVTYRAPSPPVAPPTASQRTEIEIPFEPDCSLMEKINIPLHGVSSFPSFRMPEEINHWFSECFGYKVVLAYMGDGAGVKTRDARSNRWLKAIKPEIGSRPLRDVNFSDGAALLIASEASLEDLHPRLPEGERAELDKFRPNIVVDGEGEAWGEDYWGELTILPLNVRVVLTANCARCVSINVDLEKGKMAEGEAGKMLKKMMKDRRVDKGNKWSPIFGRYGFPTSGGVVRVGDEVVVSKRNSQHTEWNGVMPRLAKFDTVNHHGKVTNGTGINGTATNGIPV